jgi:hypothetical protein
MQAIIGESNRAAAWRRDTNLLGYEGPALMLLRLE